MCKLYELYMNVVLTLSCESAEARWLRESVIPRYLPKVFFIIRNERLGLSRLPPARTVVVAPSWVTRSLEWSSQRALRRVSGNLRDGAPTIRCRARRVRARVRKTSAFRVPCVPASRARVFTVPLVATQGQFRRQSVARIHVAREIARATPNDDGDEDNDGGDDGEVSALELSQLRGPTANPRESVSAFASRFSYLSRPYFLVRARRPRRLEPARDLCSAAVIRAVRRPAITALVADDGIT